MYLSESIDKTLETCRYDLYGRCYYNEVCSILNKKFDSQFFFKSATKNYFIQDQYAVSGYYNHDDESCNIVFHFSSYYRKFSFHDDMWDSFKFTVSQVCQHEAIHKCQWQFRDGSCFTTKPFDHKTVVTEEDDKLYLSDTDEIDAYAHDIAMEIKYFYPKHNSYDILRKISRRRKLWSYNYYRSTFSGEDWQPIKKRLLKKTYGWLPYVTI